MAKRVPILDQGYNPVGERLKRITEPKAFVAPPPPAAESVPLTPTKPAVIPPASPPIMEPAPQTMTLPERALPPEIPDQHEPMSFSVRFRCTLFERRKWHELTRELTGDHHNLSHFIRAAMLLLDHAREPLQQLAPEVQRVRQPPNTNPLAIVLYEQRLAQFLYDAVKAAGRPRGSG